MTTSGCCSQCCRSPSHCSPSLCAPGHIQSRTLSPAKCSVCVFVPDDLLLLSHNFRFSAISLHSRYFFFGMLTKKTSGVKWIESWRRKKVAKPSHSLTERQQETNLEIKKVNVILHNNIQIRFTSIAQGLFMREHTQCCSLRAAYSSRLFAPLIFVLPNEFRRDAILRTCETIAAATIEKRRWRICFGMCKTLLTSAFCLDF